MLPIDPTKKLSFQRLITNGDLIIVYERHDNMKVIKVCEGSELQNRFGVFKHNDWIGKPFGSKVLSTKGGFIYVLAPTPELWTLVLSHRTQILYIADISFVVSYLEIVPGCLVLESGTGSGSLSTSLARAVAPTGHVYTFDFHEQRATSVRFVSVEDMQSVWVRSPWFASYDYLMLRRWEIGFDFDPRATLIEHVVWVRWNYLLNLGP
ncbi:hypothetical protein GIB67_017697 [Kingdonia uniflora]|uniref:tRNA (adenine(58)-N(1))-methyltransferase n=1 Tax=Kingdonia uniflora TaxID=39325 RepID=A0A7J7NAJ6_9MAGN|nr:hypothetical protein GIB67_017697 [Kingdonia uniflora]